MELATWWADGADRDASDVGSETNDLGLETVTEQRINRYGLRKAHCRCADGCRCYECGRTTMHDLGLPKTGRMWVSPRTVTVRYDGACGHRVAS